MAKKGQKFQRYSDELKLRAVTMKLDGVSHRDIMKVLDIHDGGRLPRWMRKYKEYEEVGLLDQRGRREQYVDQDRYVEKLNKPLKDLIRSLYLNYNSIYGYRQI